MTEGRSLLIFDAALAAGVGAGFLEARAQQFVERGELGGRLVGDRASSSIWSGETLDALRLAGECGLERIAEVGVVDFRIEELLMRGERNERIADLVGKAARDESDEFEIRGLDFGALQRSGFA